MTKLQELRTRIRENYKADETATADALIEQYPFKKREDKKVSDRAASIIKQVRSAPDERSQLEDYMQRYALSTDEGIALMSLAESLLRIPDGETADKLVEDKIIGAKWRDETKSGEKWLTNMSSWGLLVSDKILSSTETAFGKVLKRLGEPVIREAMVQAMRLMGGHFVTGRTINEALKNAEKTMKRSADPVMHSFDMLGEGARTWDAAKAYLQSYKDAIHAIGEYQDKGNKGPYNSHGISIKLSALNPRYEVRHRDACVPELSAALLELAQIAKSYDMNLTVDAEEAERLDVSLDIFESVIRHPSLEGWEGLGLAIQAYQKRCLCLIDWLIALSQSVERKIPVRLVKGAYWDSEIKHAQVGGYEEYPVFTRKMTTDVAYIIAAKKIFDAVDEIYPQYATHNAHTLSSIITISESNPERQFEFQRLHGMGDQLYEAVYEQNKNISVPCRIYAPVGRHQDLLPYLVRRLLENGANTSFVNQIHDPDLEIEQLARSPSQALSSKVSKPHPAIALPLNIFKERLNSKGIDLSEIETLEKLQQAVTDSRDQSYQATSIIGGEFAKGSKKKLKSTNPSDHGHVVVEWSAATKTMINKAFNLSEIAFSNWRGRGAEDRAAILEITADKLEENIEELITLLVYEAGKTVDDAIAEVREAVDFCRYYAVQARQQQGLILPGPTGEDNRLYTEARGTFVCISPWNFPLAIFIGQIAAALVTGNCVIAKPAEQTPMIAFRTIQLLHEAGIPDQVLHLILGEGDIGALLTEHKSCSGVAFTGSTETAKAIDKTLSAKDGPIVPLIAETGGLNAMIVDSSALPEQVVDDVVHSALYSAGQRCSALRVLYLQEEIADKTIEMLKGAFDVLKVGPTDDFSNDIGPVIDDNAAKALKSHQKKMVKLSGKEHSYKVKSVPKAGSFVAPSFHEIKSLSEIGGEKFGPILHIIRFEANKIEQVIKEINSSGYGLTFGIHSRIEHFIDYVTSNVRAGNVYVNRTMTGAVVGVQPFGGMNLSGTGPKAGGPHYLNAFTTEKTVSNNITAKGGNTALMVIDDEQDVA